MKLNIIRLKLNFSSMIFNFIAPNSIYICLILNFTNAENKVHEPELNLEKVRAPMCFNCRMLDHVPVRVRSCN